MAIGTTFGAVVDDRDQVICHKKFADMTVDERCRDTGIFLFNDQEEILIAKRSQNKKLLPGYWGPAATGSVEAHETYEQNAYKELEEELGVTGVELTFVGNLILDLKFHKCASGIFTGIYNGKPEDLRLEEDEVDEVRWISVEELRTWILGPQKVLDSTAPSLNAIGITTGSNTISFEKIVDEENNLICLIPKKTKLN